MCGILGFLGENFTSKHEISLKKLLHRGPDDEGICELITQNGTLFLGHQRLAIIDLSEMGHQPMIDSNGNIIIYNGEVYNFKEIKNSLEKDGINFKSHTDTEVILTLFAKEGIKCVNRFRGMFAIVIWEGKTQRLWFARDRMGIKPLYLYRGKEGVAFSSEIKAIKTLLPAKNWCINRSAITSYMAWGSVSEPNTLWEDVEMLPPATYACWDGANWFQERYWVPDLRENKTLTEKEATLEIRRLLEESISLRGIADVPLGAFLSGGIDSSILVALLARNKNKLKTLNVLFPGAGYDESEYANLIAKNYNTDHHTVTLTNEELVQNIKEAIDDMDQPSIDGINTWLVSRAARQSGLTVALSGLGGDELFYGYEGFSQIEFLRAKHRYMLAPLAEFIPIRKDRKGRLKSICKAKTDEEAFFWVRALWSSDQLKEIGYPVTLGFKNNLANNYLTNKYSYFELTNYMKDTLLRDADVMSMAHSLEVRVPFIDHKLVEFVLQIPAKIKWGDRRTPKYLLVKACEDILPKEVVYRKKMGFTLPFDYWLRNQLKTEVEKKLLELERSNIFPPGFVIRQWEDFGLNRLQFSRIWQLFILAQKI